MGTNTTGVQLYTTKNGVECAKIPFLWDTVTAMRDQQGQIWVDVNALMSQIEISGGAVARTKEWKGFASCRKSIRLDYDVGHTNITCLTLDCMPKWLNSLNSVTVRNRATQATALKLEQYQEHSEELVDAVRAVFYGKEVTTPTVAEAVASEPEVVSTDAADAPKPETATGGGLDVRTVRFMDGSFTAVRDTDNEILVNIRDICSDIGLTDCQGKAQTKKVRYDVVLADKCRIVNIPTNGGNQNCLCLNLDAVRLWLPKIATTPNMIAKEPAVVARLKDYQTNVDGLVAATIEEFGTPKVNMCPAVAEGTTAVVKFVSFLGTNLIAVQDNDGQIWAGVRWICNGIGLTDGQTKNERLRIQQDAVLSKVGRNFVLPTEGGSKSSLCIQLDAVPLWLAKISVTPAMKRDSPDVAARLVEYQLKAQKVLADAFIPKELQSGKQQPDFDDDATAMAYGMMAAARKIERLEGKIAEDAPKVRFYRDVGDADGTITIEEFAKLLYARDHIDVGEYRLFGMLRQNKILTKKNLPYQRYLDNGCFVMVETPYGSHGQVRLQARITTKGQQMLHEMFFNTDDFIKVLGDRKSKKKK